MAAEARRQKPAQVGTKATRPDRRRSNVLSSHRMWTGQASIDLFAKLVQVALRKSGCLSNTQPEGHFFRCVCRCACPWPQSR